MGCVSSKSIDTAVATAEAPYCPPPTSVALFDINTVEEPWLIMATTLDADEEKAHQQAQKDIVKPAGYITLPLLEKLENFDLAPQYSWSDVSKALQDLKPTLDQQKTQSTVENPKQPTKKKVEAPPPLPSVQPPELTGIRAVKENSFIIRDRLERESNKSSSDANAVKWKRRDPLEGYEERCPPGNSKGVVLYTTTLRGVRRTFEDCEWARRIVELNAVDAGVGVDERNVSLHGEFLKEVRELVGESEAAPVPRLFVMGRYVGGVEEMMEVNESGKLREMMRWVKKRGEGEYGSRVGCEGCGGARFVPCMECNGSCKVLGEDGKEVVRCGKCNENGLVLCPLCH